MPAHLLEPLRLNVRNAATKQTRSLHQFGRHNPAPWFLGQMRAGVGKKLDAARAQVLAVLSFFKLAANIAQETGQHGQM